VSTNGGTSYSPITGATSTTLSFTATSWHQHIGACKGTGVK
jgi:hypothetical protein